MKIKTSELTGAALDWAVAKCAGYSASISRSGEVIIMREGVVDYFDPHRNWSWGGPIIEQDEITLHRMTNDWVAVHNPSGGGQPGPTPLIAAMRRYVTSKLGDEVEVPEELLS